MSSIPSHSSATPVEAEVEIERLSELGAGVARWQGRSVFIDRTVPGDRARILIEPAGKVLKGRVLELLQRGPGRVDPSCVLSDRCGGCDWLHVDESLRRRTQVDGLVRILADLGGLFPGTYVLRPLRSLQPSGGARSRASFHLHGNQLTFFEGQSHRPVGIDRCIALVPELESLPGRLAPILEGIAKDVETVQLLAVGAQTALALKLRTEVRERHRKVAQQAMSALGFRGVVLTPPQGREELVGKPRLQLHGAPPGSAEAMGGGPRWLRPDTFGQAHLGLNTILVREAVRDLALEPGCSVLELFAGNGNFTFSVAAAGARVTAVESSRVSLDLARTAVAASGGRQALGGVPPRFVLGDAERVCRGLRDEGARFDRLLLDPPRAGFEGAGSWAKALGVERGVYVSCNPASLARDVGALARNGYRVLSVEPFEMFPQTHHLEVLMAFERT